MCSTSRIERYGTTGVDVLSDYLAPDPNSAHKDISVLGLAHLGDAVFELMVRTWLCMSGVSTAKSLHSGTVAVVAASAQAAAAERLIPELDGEELAIYKRGRNAHVNSVPHGSTFEEYHAATGIEALFGYLYLNGRTQRLDALFERAVGIAK